MHNLTLLSDAERNRIELDKQAAYAVWQVKQAKVGYEVFAEIANKIDDDDEREFFEQAVMKYKQQMGL
ncbi:MULTISPECIES: DUF3283 family protein [Photobacterium]|uniref:Pyridoxamine 5-phosphate oxidase n=1 Tax=Photobacterium ganghwense TaxID=320778 RepID=A0A0J1HDR7_9GAMM|nr:MULTISPECIES: DUF3283 family protein [Photobacterium]KLV09781.1 pyridoxamine 5-phosphate oxidase [Photobacterium ganghwense]PSU09378.1 DUF3283 domain-containing protein [Photobacterium ganghwense]QSV16568.1 DUF3283 family protein [Photobacterium ganghwense]